MKYLLIVALFLNSCVSINNGESVASKYVSIEDVQGCYYNEDLSESYSDWDLKCDVVCIRGDRMYKEYKFMYGSYNESTQTFTELSVINVDIDTIPVEIQVPNRSGELYENVNHYIYRQDENGMKMLIDIDTLFQNGGRLCKNSLL